MLGSAGGAAAGGTPPERFEPMFRGPRAHRAGHARYLRRGRKSHARGHRLKMHYRNWMALGHDAVAAAIAWYLAYWLRFNTEIPQFNIPNMLGSMLWVVPLQALIFFGSGMYRGMWRYASVPDLQRIALAVGLSTLTIALVLLMLPHQEPPVPRSVILLDPMLLILLLGGSRLGYRVWKERRPRNVLGSSGKPVVVLGAGDAAADLLKNLARAGDWRVLGLFDDNPAKRGREIHGVNVLGPLDDLIDLVPRLGLERAIIAMPGSHQSRRRALELCRRAGVQALTVPSYQDLMSGEITVSQVRNIELDDLLGRDPVVLDDSRLHGSAAATWWSPAPADRSARSCAGRSRVSNRRAGAVRAQRIRAVSHRAGTGGQYPGD